MISLSGIAGQFCSTCGTTPNLALEPTGWRRHFVPRQRLNLDVMRREERRG